MQVITQESLLYTDIEQFITPATIIPTDIDGTAAPLIKDPAQRFIDSNIHRAFAGLNKIAPGHVIPVTGRDHEQVKQCFHGKDPKFPVISSNGAQLHLPGGANGPEVHTHPFTLPENVYIDYMRLEMMGFKALHPELVAEVKRFEIGRHVEPAHGYGHIAREEIRRKADICDAMMEKLESEANKRGVNFNVASTEVTHREMSHRGVDKLLAITKSFASYLPESLQSDDWKNVVYLGDSLLKGNDRTIAMEVRKRGGTVCQVINGVPDRIPPKGDPARPHLVFNDPEALGICLRKQVENLFRPSALAHPQARRALRS